MATKPTIKKRVTQRTLKLTISLAEVEQLRSENAALKQQVAELHSENEALKKRIERAKRPRPQVEPHKSFDPGVGM